MKKLIVKIGNETHELPYNGEAVKIEVSEKYTPKVGDCVKVVGENSGVTTFFKVECINNDGNIEYKHCVDLYKGKNEIDLDSFWFLNTKNFTQITPEELKAKYAEAGYDWDYETDTIKPLKWMPKDGDEVWWLTNMFTVSSFIYNSNDNTHKELLSRKLLFPTEEKCKEFLDHCLQFHKK